MSPSVFYTCPSKGSRIVLRQTPIGPNFAQEGDQAHRPVAAPTVFISDFEEGSKLGKESPISVENLGRGVPDVGCFGAGAIDLDDLEALSSEKRFEVVESDIKAAEVETWNRRSNRFDAFEKFIRHHPGAIFENSSLAVVTSKNQGLTFAILKDALKILAVAIEINTCYLFDTDPGIEEIKNLDNSYY